MSVAAAAMHFGAAHEEAPVLVRLDRCLVDGLPVAGPAGAGFELRRGIEQRRTAADAAIQPFAMVVPVLATECALGALLARDAILQVVELRPPLVGRLTDLVGHAVLRPHGTASAGLPVRSKTGARCAAP